MNYGKLVSDRDCRAHLQLQRQGSKFSGRIIFSKLTVTNVSLDRCGEILELGDQIGSAVKHEIKIINKHIRRRY